MNREIKFRARAIQDGQWIVGDLIHKRYNGDKEVIIQEPNGCGTDCDIHTVGQFTGLKDKNGREIFEGDVVETVFPYKYEIVFLNGRFARRTIRNKQEYYSLTKGWENDICIIGNIHENPELMKGGR